MTATLIISISTIVGIIVSLFLKPQIKIKKFEISIYWIISLLGAILLLCFSCISTGELWVKMTQNTSINPLKLLVIFFSMTLLSVFLDEVGFFNALAQYTIKKAKTSQTKLFLYLFLIISVLTVFTSNDIVILTFTPFILYFSKSAKINPIPYLVGEFVAANTFSMLLIIGNPTNIYLATSFDVSFFEYFKVMLIPSVLAGTCAFFIMFFIFKKELINPLEVNLEEVKITSKFLLYIGIIHLALCIILLAISSYIGFEMWYICLSFVISLIFYILGYSIVKKEKPSVLLCLLKRAPWELIPFVLSMFVIVMAITNVGLTAKLFNLLDSKYPIVVYGFVSFFASNLLNNIPMSVLFSNVLLGMGESGLFSGLFATIIGSNIGAYFTPIGALAGIMWLKILKHNQMNFSFLKFLKFGLVIALPIMAISLFGLWLALLVF